MCGIVAIIYRTSESAAAHKLIEAMGGCVSRRGHDHVTKQHFVPLPGSDWCIGVLGCVLHMRGDLTPQPVCNEGGDWLLWNGEVFNSSVFEVSDTTNDSIALLKCLSSRSQTVSDTLRVFESIQGPWSMIYYQAKPLPCLWFGRDVLGRRSLVWCSPSDNMFVVSSLALVDAIGTEWKEIPTIGIYRLSLMRELQFKEIISCYSWKHKDDNVAMAISPEHLDQFPIIKVDNNEHLIVPFRRLNCTVAMDTGSAGMALFDECSVKLLQLLQDAVAIRVASWKGNENIGILFSGGLDSVLIAALVDRCLNIDKEVDLINIAFSKDSEDDYNVPDRKAAIQALKELNSQRKWNLILVDVSSCELKRLRLECVHPLIHPSNTVMDDSIGCALWFAARGKGTRYQDGRHYETNCKVLLVGMGADEQFGGYSRHRAAFEKGGWQHVLDEVSKDMQRISKRNLGRDDRCISDHHREARYPYLDERVVDYANSLPIWIKTDYSHPRGLGEKILLRRIATMLGCPKTAEMPKRAIQFGSRIAKISGTDSGTKEMSSLV